MALKSPSSMKTANVFQSNVTMPLVMLTRPLSGKRVNANQRGIVKWNVPKGKNCILIMNASVRLHELLETFSMKEEMKNLYLQVRDAMKEDVTTLIKCGILIHARVNIL